MESSSKLAKKSLEDLSAEVLLHVFRFLSADCLALAISRVSKSFYDLSNDASLWREMIQEGSLDANRSRHLIPPNNEWRELFIELKQLNKVSMFPFSLLEKGIEASSTDHRKQSIENTLLEGENTFWSSTGKADPGSDEYLVYKLKQPSLISAVTIVAYQACFQQGQPIYAPREMKISVGFGPKNIHWTSKEYPVKNIREPQTFPLPELVVGTYLRLDLLGRYQTQPQDDLWYTVLEYVKCNGYPFGVLKNQNILQASILEFATQCECFLQEFNVQDQDENTRKASLEPYRKRWRREMRPLMDKEEKRKNEIARIVSAVHSGELSKAISLVAQLPQELRTDELFLLFKQQETKVLKNYFNEMLKLDTPLTKYESLELVKFLLTEHPQKHLPLVASCIEQDRLTLSQELADFIRQFHKPLALMVYLDMSIPDKIIDCLKELKQYNKIIPYSNLYRYQIDYLKLLDEIQQENSVSAVEFAIQLAETEGGSPVGLDRVCDVLGIDHSSHWDLRKLIKQRLAELTKV